MMRDFHPAQTRSLAAVAEEADAPAPQPTIGEEVHYLSLDRDGEVAAVRVHHHPVQHVRAHVERKRLFDSRYFLAVDHRIPHDPHLGQRTGFRLGKLQGVVIVQVSSTKHRTHPLAVDFAQKLEAVIGQVGGRLQDGQRPRTHEAGRIVRPARGQVGAAVPGIQAGPEIVRDGDGGALRNILLNHFPAIVQRMHRAGRGGAGHTRLRNRRPERDRQQHRQEHGDGLEIQRRGPPGGYRPVQEQRQPMP